LGESSVRRWPAYCALLSFIILPACRRDAQSHLEGSYRTISESEWNIVLTLKREGVAEIIEESWAPGEYESRSAYKTEGRWRAEGDIVILEYDGITDRLLFDPQLSLAPIGYRGGAPGLRQGATFAEESILRDHPLWKLPPQFGQLDPRKT
jgi:hypothetical protein